MQQDLYALIGTVPEASAKEIKTAYRKTALSCHPDKNPDNPKAAELFHQLSKALEVLIDDSARAAYDKVLKARHQTKLRLAQYDSKRRKLKDDLEAREEAHRRSQAGSRNPSSDEQKLKAEIERLQKEGAKLVEEEIAFVHKKMQEQLNGAKGTGKRKPDGSNTRVKIKWAASKDDASNGGYDYETLHRILSKYGDIEVLVISSSKKGSALVEFKKPDAAATAAQLEIGLSKNPLRLHGLWESDKQSKQSTTDSTTYSTTQSTPRGPGLFPSTDTAASTRKTTFPSFNSAPDVFANQRKMSDAEFETHVLQNMKRAQERKKLLEDLKAEEGT